MKVLALVFLTCQILLLAADHALEPGILPFEFAFSGEAAAGILVGWGPEGRRVAVAAHIVDYPYLVAYGLGLRGLVRQWGGGRLAVLPLVAAGCDAVENAALLGMLGVGPSDALAVAAGVFASAKFTLLGITGAALLGRRLRG